MIYFIQSLDTVKIGYTDNLSARKKQLESANPHGIVVIGTVVGDMNMEKTIHKNLDKYRLNGEWFKNCSAVRNYIDMILRREIRIRYQQTRFKDDGSWMDYNSGTETVVLESGDAQTISFWQDYVDRKFAEKRAITKEISETQIEINMLLAKKQRLEKKYIKTVKEK